MAVAPPQVSLPAYAPELDLAGSVFRALRPVIEGEPDASLNDKQARAKAWLLGRGADPNREHSLTDWAWLAAPIHATLQPPTPL